MKLKFKINDCRQPVRASDSFLPFYLVFPKLIFIFAEINSFTGYGQKDIGIRNLLHWETVSAAAIATTGNI